MAVTTIFSTIVADDLLLMSESLSALCEGFVGCRVLGHCQDGEEALRMISELRPDVALLDLNLRRMVTMDVVRKARQKGLPTKLVVLSVRGDRKTVLETLRGGANAFVLKGGTGRHLEEAFRQVLIGAVYVSPLVELQDLVTPQSCAGQDPIKTLSAREYQVFSLLVEGARAKEIASKLSLSPKTVDTHRANLMRKLDMHDMPSLVKFAILHKLTA